MKRESVFMEGHEVGYVELLPLGHLWKAFPNGVAEYLPPAMFATRAMAEGFVREYGRAKAL